MSKVITFSRVFPSYHPKKGDPTYFVEKLLSSINYKYYDEYRQFNPRLSVDSFEPKHHTIRAGHRWKVGDKFSPRAWSGKPYNSKQIIIAPDVEIKKIWDIGLIIRGDFKEFYCGDCDLTGTSISLLAKNDGLEINDLFNWFNKPFEGQIICWNENIKY